ncbi:MAG: class I SAM-dependent methyltransferase [Magnetospirillum sp.]|nr:class I SAM-dependent methyltransferase [Magnetospirillum sp.]
MNDRKSDMRALERHYSELFRKHGDTPAATQQRDRETQERRMGRLCEIAPDVAQARILDFGCGAGHLLHVLRRDFDFCGRFTGYDLSLPHIEAARTKFPDAVFERRDILEVGIEGRFDYAFVNGTFNNLIADNWGFVTEVLATLYGACDRGVAFNLLSSYVDYNDTGLYYAEPERIFAHCKREITPLVTLRHDYRLKPGVIPYEFTVYLHRNG